MAVWTDFFQIYLALVGFVSATIVVEFRRGSSEENSKGTSSRLKIAADFVVQVYEADLIRRKLAYRAEPEYSSQMYGYSDLQY